MMIDLPGLLEVTTGIACDSRQVKPGYIFVAIYGRADDGNRFAAAAEKKGAIAVVTDRPDNLSGLSIPVVAVPDARRTLAEIAARFYRHPSRDMALIGVSGTNGKTTVTFMLEHIFRQAGYTTGLIGTVCVNVGKTSFASILTTPDSVSLQKYLALMRQNNVTHAAMEVSAQGMELQRVHDVTFSCGVLTNISPDHLDFHGSFPAYLTAKQRFTKLLGPTAPLIVNNADPYCRSTLCGYSGPVVTAAIAAPADLTADIQHYSSRSSIFDLVLTRSLTTVAGRTLNPGTIRVALKLPGRHNVENAVLAMTAALLHGIPAEVAADALATFAGVPRRMEIYHLSGKTVIDDTALNPGSLTAVFNALGAFRYRRLIVVNAIRGSRGDAINAVNATTLARYWLNHPYTLIVTSSQESVGPADIVNENEKSAFCEALEQATIPYLFTDSLTEALMTALTVVSSGDLLLLLGAQGMDDGHHILLQLDAEQERHTGRLGLEAASSLV